MTNPPDQKTKTPRTDKCLSQYDDFGQYRSEPRRLELLAIESSTLELENQSLTRRLEEVEENLENSRILQREHLANSIAKGKQLTALRTAAEAARDALADMIRGAQKQNWQDNYPQEINAAYKAIAALRAELDQPASNASNSPTASRESQG